MEWKGHVSIDKRIILKFLSEKREDDREERALKTAGLQLFGVLVAVGIKIFDPFEDAAIQEKEVYHRLLECLSFKAKEVSTRGTPGPTLKDIIEDENDNGSFARAYPLLTS